MAAPPVGIHSERSQWGVTGMSGAGQGMLRFCNRWPRSLADPARSPPDNRVAAVKTRGGPPVDTPATYLQWGFLLISLPNLIVIVVMVALFVLALLAPFPRHGPERDEDASDDR